MGIWFPTSFVEVVLFLLVCVFGLCKELGGCGYADVNLGSLVYLHVCFCVLDHVVFVAIAL